MWVLLFLVFRTHTTNLLQTTAVKKPESTASWGKYQGPRTNQPAKVHTQACLTRDFSTLTREIYDGSSRPDPHKTRTSRATRGVEGRVGSTGFQISRVGRVWSGGCQILRVGPGRVKRSSNLAGQLTRPDPTRPDP